MQQSISGVTSAAALVIVACRSSAFAFSVVFSKEK
jgi:hypothetical protein